MIIGAWKHTDVVSARVAGRYLNPIDKKLLVQVCTHMHVQHFFGTSGPDGIERAAQSLYVL